MSVLISALVLGCCTGWLPVRAMAQNDAPATASLPVVQRAFRLPPAATLSYTIVARQSGFSLSGTGEVIWDTTADSYRIHAESTAPLFGKVLEAVSHGHIDRYGLAPDEFTDRRLRHAVTTTTFQRDQAIIRFSESGQRYPIKGAEQDRSSVVWQLAAQFNAAPARFKPDSRWDYFVAGPSDADVWTFRVIGNEQIRSGLGTIDALHLSRLATTGDHGRQLDVWLAPQHYGYPVRIKFSEENGDFLDQTISAIAGPQAGQ